VTIAGYINLGAIPRAMFTISNGHSWPIGVAAAMPEIKSSNGWENLWKEAFDYRAYLELDPHSTCMFSMAVPPNAQPTCLRFLWYREENRIEKPFHNFLRLLHLEESGAVLYPDAHPVYSKELVK
jgi:hypothetical protein